MTTRTRLTVHQGIAAYFGGTFSSVGRCWQGGPLVPYGLGTVRLAHPKFLNDADYFVGMPSGSQTGGFISVDLGDDVETRRGIAGPPVNDGNRNITAGGIKEVEYKVTLNLYTLSQCEYAEDAQVNFDTLFEQVKQQIRLDRTLGGIGDQAGEGRFGIRSHQYMPVIDGNERTLIDAWVQFEVMTQIVA